MNINRINAIEPVGRVDSSETVARISKTERGASIQVSSEARQAQTLRLAADVAMSSPAIRTDRVADLKAKINDPSYMNDTLISHTADHILKAFGL
jgi:negative regulator of flagellin synthesis FlgM